MLAHKVLELAPNHYMITGFDLPDFDLTDRAQVSAEIERLQPAVIVNCAAYTNVDGAESDEELATRVNGAGPGYLAEAAKTTGAVLVHISTDYVFDGRKQSPYLETDPVGPISAYGRSKLAGEQAILTSGLERYFIIRTSWLYGPGGRNFVETIIRLSQERKELRVVADQFGTPTYTGDLAEAMFYLLKLTDHDLKNSPHPSPLTPYGIYHFSNSGQCSWQEFAIEIIAQMRRQGASLKVERVVPIRTEEYPLPAPRPAFSVFSKGKYRAATGATIPDWQGRLNHYLQERIP
jgi:dTDP-4-dehydrorhamnose reductase